MAFTLFTIYYLYYTLADLNGYFLENLTIDFLNKKSLFSKNVLCQSSLMREKKITYSAIVQWNL